MDFLHPISRISYFRLSDVKKNAQSVFFVQDLFHLLDANGGDTASQEELVKAGRCFFFSLPAEILLEWSLF